MLERGAILLGLLLVWGPARGAQIEKDLQLRVKRLGARVVGPQEPIKLQIELVNRSRTRSHHVVKPGDGSEMGWREPRVYYTAEVREADGSWTELPRRTMARCGLFDPDWRKDVVELEPGRSIPIKDWLPPPERAVELQRPGEVRLFVHYRYSQGRAAKGGPPKVTPGTGRMGDTPGFHLVSSPVTIRVVRPLDLVLKAIKPRLAAGWSHRLSKILTVTVTNRSKKPVAVTSGADELRFELEGNHGRAPRIDTSSKPAPISLRPGQTASLLGAGRLDGQWSYPEAGKLRVRVVYTPSSPAAHGEIASGWVELELFKKKR